MNDANIFIVGAKGQLGLALQAQYPRAKTAGINELDITDQESVQNYDWSDVKVIINTAAFTNVDGAETNEGRITAWQVNAVGVSNLVKLALIRDILLVHISSEYVFDGSKNPHIESEPLSPLSVYGQSKAAGDLLVSLLPKYYLIRASWVIGEGKNFVRTMLDLGKKGVEPSVVNDQVGRLTFTSELVRGIDYLLNKKAAYGIYNLSNEGQPSSWADIARAIYKLAGYDLKVTDTTTAEYFVSKQDVAPRPLNSTLSLDKIHDSGFISRDWYDDLRDYIERERNR
jgi:dTDP-4-dehydrorhamnose 3,5-epimerase